MQACTLEGVAICCLPDRLEGCCSMPWKWLTLLAASGTSSAAMAAALVTRDVLDARPAFGSWATAKLGLPTTGLDISADCMAAVLLSPATDSAQAISPAMIASAA